MTKLVKIQLAIAVPLILAGGFFAFFIYQQIFKDLSNNISITNQPPAVFFSKLDGTNTPDDNQIDVVAVMIENHVDARPQSGLSKARIVYEVLAESDITRFLAIFDLADDVEKIGPVRSARPYYIDLASEYQAIYAHSGGSPKAIDRLKNEDAVFNLDEFFGYNSGYFWRAKEKYAPHNLYTSSELLGQAKSHYDLAGYDNFEPWKFKDGQANTVDSLDIQINYSQSPSYQVNWKYLKDSNTYERWQNKSRHLDEDDSLIEADNVIIQYAPTKILDDIGRRDIKLIGTGQAIVFRDGVAIVGYWQKKDTISRTVFYDDKDNEIELNRGQIWIEIVPIGLEVIY